MSIVKTHVPGNISSESLTHPQKNNPPQNRTPPSGSPRVPRKQTSHTVTKPNLRKGNIVTSTPNKSSSFHNCVSVQKFRHQKYCFWRKNFKFKFKTINYPIRKTKSHTTKKWHPYLPCDRNAFLVVEGAVYQIAKKRKTFTEC